MSSSENTAELPKLGLISKEDYKILSEAEKQTAYVVLRVPKKKILQKIVGKLDKEYGKYVKNRNSEQMKDITNILETDIVGINTAGVLAILNGAVHPKTDWLKNIANFPTKGQEIDYAKTYPSQSNLIASLQNKLLENELSTVKQSAELSFTSPIEEKYVWAFEQLQKDNLTLFNVNKLDKSTSDELLKSYSNVKSVVEVYY